jgi:hypothetical protein
LLLDPSATSGNGWKRAPRTSSALSTLALITLGLTDVRRGSGALSLHAATASQSASQCHAPKNDATAVRRVLQL